MSAPDSKAAAADAAAALRAMPIGLARLGGGWVGDTDRRRAEQVLGPSGEVAHGGGVLEGEVPPQTGPVPAPVRPPPPVLAEPARVGWVRVLDHGSSP